MSCKGIIHQKPRAQRHFFSRFVMRKIYEVISLIELETTILQYYASGNFIEDRRHPGVEGPRYRFYIPRKNKKIIVIAEKTKSCLLLITVWPENSG
ncbi:MAG: hypothetical protein ACTSVA_03030 [Candidatus Njordarchaeales archaeon]